MHRHLACISVGGGGRPRQPGRLPGSAGRVPQRWYLAVDVGEKM